MVSARRSNLVPETLCRCPAQSFLVTHPRIPRQLAVYATRIQSKGVEVWFDQSELRGGDEWDHSIRRQIKACALFIPVNLGELAGKARRLLQAGVEAGR
jgi:hypothetical protein